MNIKNDYNYLLSDLTKLKGVGRKTASLLKRKKINTIFDLLWKCWAPIRSPWLFFPGRTKRMSTFTGGLDVGFLFACVVFDLVFANVVLALDGR